ncbi:GyrI-like domain-containing protein [Thalassovita sp.]|uniref:GyrI-like domain-containing protein n=1 Tax=Thalassovita sp. TaxID=1979401 RepID=UPI002B270C77|nr:GyrI-like domain-containing protein [Thalassovita sp.]
MGFLVTSPEIVDFPEQTVIGFGGEFRLESRDEIPKLWWQLHTEWKLVENGVRRTTIGVYQPLQKDRPFSYYEPYSYLAGVVAEDGETCNSQFKSELLQGGCYGRFRFIGSFVEVTDAFDSIMLNWLPESGFQLDNRAVFERYPSYPFGSSAIPKFEIWLPMAQRV